MLRKLVVYTSYTLPAVLVAVGLSMPQTASAIWSAAYLPYMPNCDVRGQWITGANGREAFMYSAVCAASCPSGGDRISDYISFTEIHEGAQASFLSTYLKWRGQDVGSADCRPISGYTTKDQFYRRHFAASVVSVRGVGGCDCRFSPPVGNVPAMCGGYNFMINQSVVRLDSTSEPGSLLYTSVTEYRTGCYSDACWFVSSGYCTLTCPSPSYPCVLSGETCGWVVAQPLLCGGPPWVP